MLGQSLDSGRRANAKGGDEAARAGKSVRCNHENRTDEYWDRTILGSTVNSGVSDCANGALVAGKPGVFRMDVHRLNESGKDHQQHASESQRSTKSALTRHCFDSNQA